jgi:photosystem II stability/assembly factor-like uncharacterized protein
MNGKHFVLKLRTIVAALLVLAALVGPSGLLHTPAASAASANWVQQYTGQEVLKFASTDANHLWASTSRGYVLWTDNGGQTWNPVDAGAVWGAVLHGVDFADNLNGWTGGEAGTGGILFHTTDGGRTWQQQFDGSGQRIFAVEVLSPSTVIIVGGGTQFTIARRSTDAGKTWITMPVNLNDAMFLDVFFLDASTGWIVGSQGGIAKTTDGGDTWTVQPAPSNWGLKRVHFADANNGWAGGYYGMLERTSNSGASWTQQNPVLPAYTHVLGVAAVNSTTAWISGYGGGAQSRPYVKRTTDGGTTWVQDMPTVGPYDSFAAVKFLDAENGWAGGFAGIFRRSGTTSVAAPIATKTATATATATASTRTIPATATATTRTVASTATATATRRSASATATATPTRRTTPATSTATTRLATVTSTATATTSTVAATATATARTGTVPLAPTNTPTATSTPELTPVSSDTPIPTGGTTECFVAFSDVPEGSTFRAYVQCLACLNVLGGYSDGTFHPQGNITRGQLSKLVSNAAGYNESVSGQTFSDVPPGSPFYTYVERIVGRGIISGYGDGTFRAGEPASRGQIAKIVANAAGLSGAVSGQTFSDVPPGSSFYPFIERLSARDVIGGYQDGTFRSSEPATRGQVSKIIANTFFPDCQTP